MLGTVRREGVQRYDIKLVCGKAGCSFEFFTILLVILVTSSYHLYLSLCNGTCDPDLLVAVRSRG